MAEPETQTQSATINTSQPTPLRGLVLRGRKSVPTVETEHGGRVNVSDYNEEAHGKKLSEKLPTRKKKAVKKVEAAPVDEEGEDEVARHE